MTTVYIGERQSGKTTMLIEMSEKTGATIVVATYQMAKYIQLLLLLRKNAKVPKIKTTGIMVLRAMRVPSERIGLWNATATPV